MAEAAQSPSALEVPDGSPVPWWLLVFVGLLAIVAGVLALVWPGKTLLLVALTFGLYLIFSGVGDLVGSFSAGGAGKGVRLLTGLLGVLAIVAGVLLVARPGLSLFTLAWILAIWFLAAGVLQLMQGIAVSESRGFNILFGLIGIAAGIILLSDPRVAIKTLVWIVSISFIVRGMVAISLGMLLRRAESA